MRAAKAQASLRSCTGSPVPSWVENVTSAEIQYAGSYGFDARKPVFRHERSLINTFVIFLESIISQLATSEISLF